MWLKSVTFAIKKAKIIYFQYIILYIDKGKLETIFPCRKSRIKCCVRNGDQFIPSHQCLNLGFCADGQCSSPLLQIVRHGGALGLGLAALGTARQDVYDLLKSNLYQDDAVTGM